jgi:AraC-like DNA-binding protein
MDGSFDSRASAGDAATAPAVLHHVPSGPLADYVELFWYWRGHSVPRSAERVLPMGTMELVIRLGAYGAPAGGISGPHSNAFLIERTNNDELLGIHFKPGGAFPFLGSPAGDLRNRYVQLEDLWGRERANALIAVLHEAPSIHAKFAILEQWLLRIGGRSLERHPAVAFALAKFRHDWALGSVGKVVDTVNLSQRRFIAVFRDQVGLTPKVYCRIQRFQRILDRVAYASHVDWLETALACGYFDQSHFIHDFCEFTGLRPTDYWDLRIEGQTNHVRVID